MEEHLIAFNQHFKENISKHKNQQTSTFAEHLQQKILTRNKFKSNGYTTTCSNELTIKCKIRI